MIATVFKICSSIAMHFYHSTVANAVLVDAEENLGMKKYTLIQTYVTRWNSSYYMVQQIIEQRNAVLNVLNNKTVTNRYTARVLEMKEFEWEFSENLFDILKPFEVTTVCMAVEK